MQAELLSRRMKLVIAVIHNRDKGRVVDALLESQFKFTQVASTGGFLREGNTTLLIGVEDSQVESLLRLLESNCRTREQYVNPMLRRLGASFPPLSRWRSAARSYSCCLWNDSSGFSVQFPRAFDDYHHLPAREPTWGICCTSTLHGYSDFA
jgi:uncharacterized protein YaaQ